MGSLDLLYYEVWIEANSGLILNLYERETWQNELCTYVPTYT